MPKRFHRPSNISLCLYVVGLITMVFLNQLDVVDNKVVRSSSTYISNLLMLLSLLMSKEVKPDVLKPEDLKQIIENDNDTNDSIDLELDKPEPEPEPKQKEKTDEKL